VERGASDERELEGDEDEGRPQRTRGGVGDAGEGGDGATAVLCLLVVFVEEETGDDGGLEERNERTKRRRWPRLPIDFPLSSQSG
jgi:hypothetical protein